MVNKKYKKIIDSADIISFDIFDTLIDRTINKPSDVFDIVEKIYNKDNNIEELNGFKKIRIEAEKTVRRNTKEEITIDDIYNNIKSNHPKINTDRLKSIEKNAELCICKKKMDNMDIYNYCVQNNKKIIICSDMYLPLSLIKKILLQNGISFSKIFLSCEVNKTKRNGTIFKHIINDLKIKPKKIVHIGDNLKSDIIVPKKYGFKTIYLKKRKRKTNNNLIIDYALNNAEYDISNSNDYFYNFGYKYLGIILLNFCKFLKENNKNKNIVFLSREGNFLKKCYDEFIENDKSKYMYVSRKSISAALLYMYDSVYNMIQDQSLSPLETVEMFLKRWDMINDNNIILLEKNDIELDSPINNDEVIKKIQNILEELKTNSESQKKHDNFSSYLDQLGINEQTSIVDIGWSGTMQDLIQKELNNKGNIIISGYYLGVRSKKKNKFKNGFLFNGENDDIEILSRSMTEFLEILFSADHGTTLGYVNKGGKIHPILAENDIRKDELIKIQKIQTGCLDFLKKYRNDTIMSSYKYTKEAYKPLFDFCINPKLKDIAKFEKFYSVDEKQYGLVGNNLGLMYLFHLKKFKNDYISSGWKNAFMKSIFKVKLPYNSFFKFAYKRRG